MTKTKAIAHAKEKIGCLYRFGNGYRFHSYDDEKQLAWESTPREYYAAKVERSQALLDFALMFIDLPFVQYEKGSWTDYIKTKKQTKTKQ